MELTHYQNINDDPKLSNVCWRYGRKTRPSWKIDSDLETFLLKMNKNAVENAMKLAENDDENVVKLAENAVENAKKLAENDDENVVLKNINNLNLIG